MVCIDVTIKENFRRQYIFSAKLFSWLFYSCTTLMEELYDAHNQSSCRPVEQIKLPFIALHWDMASVTGEKQNLNSCRHAGTQVH